MQIDSKTIKNILMVRNDRFGEFLLNIPAMQAIKETFTNAKLTVIINPYVRELAKGIPFIDEMIEWSQEDHSLTAKLKLMRLLKKRNIDIAVMLNPSKEFNILTYLSGIPVRVGYDRKWGFLLTHKMKDKKYLGQKHEIDYNLELVSLIGAKTQDKTLSLIIENDVIKNICQEFNIENNDNFVALHPWTSDPIKQWPLDNFRALAQRLIEKLGIKLVIIGGKEESVKSLEYFNNQGNNPINLTGKTTLKQLAALLRRCKLLISCDSGPVHLASCVGIPVIAIFRSDIPGKNSVRWGPRSYGSIVIEKPNLSDISIEEVFQKAKEIMIK